MITMSYHGAEKVIENYGIMGPVKAALECTVRYVAAELGPRAFACTLSVPDRSQRALPRSFAISMDLWSASRAKLRLDAWSQSMRSAWPAFFSPVPSPGR